MIAHRGLKMLSYLIAIDDNRVIEPEALAGCDKLQVLTKGTS